jgi:hypothetical protein
MTFHILWLQFFNLITELLIGNEVTFVTRQKQMIDNFIVIRNFV